MPQGAALFRCDRRKRSRIARDAQPDCPDQHHRDAQTLDRTELIIEGVLLLCGRGRYVTVLRAAASFGVPEQTITVACYQSPDTLIPIVPCNRNCANNGLLTNTLKRDTLFS